MLKSSFQHSLVSNQQGTNKQTSVQLSLNDQCTLLVRCPQELSAKVYDFIVLHWLNERTPEDQHLDSYIGSC